MNCSMTATFRYKGYKIYIKVLAFGRPTLLAVLLFSYSVDDVWKDRHFNIC